MIAAVVSAATTVIDFLQQADRDFSHLSEGLVEVGIILIVVLLAALLDQAVSMGADCFITGEVKHNLALDAMDMGCCVIEAGHFETENPVCEVLAGALQNAADALKYNVTVFCSKVHPFGR